MRPYCPNNSNFTFRNICCDPPPCTEIHEEHCCGCKPQKPGCYYKPHNHCNETYSQKSCCNRNSFTNGPQFMCFPICFEKNCACNPFTFIMIGYMMGKQNNNCFNDELF